MKKDKPNYIMTFSDLMTLSMGFFVILIFISEAKTNHTLFATVEKTLPTLGVVFVAITLLTGIYLGLNWLKIKHGRKRKNS